MHAPYSEVMSYVQLVTVASVGPSNVSAQLVR